MADKKISTMANADPLDGTEYVPLVQNGANVKGNTRDIVKSFASVNCGELMLSGVTLFPIIGGTGFGGIIEKGNEFDIVGTGTLGDNEINDGLKLTLRALDENPLQDETKWKIY